LLINMLGLTLCGKSNFEVIISTKAITAKKRLKSQKSNGNNDALCSFSFIAIGYSLSVLVFLNKNLMKHG